MKSSATARFWKLLRELPEPIRKQAREAFQLFMKNPDHPSLRFKQVHDTKPIYSVRISRDFRVLGGRDPKDDIVWFWVGTHADYDNLLGRL